LKILMKFGYVFPLNLPFI